MLLLPVTAIHGTLGNAEDCLQNDAGGDCDQCVGWLSSLPGATLYSP